MFIKNTFYLASVLMLAAPVMAEFSCSSDITYKWGSGDQEQEVSWVSASAVGPDEATAKAELINRINIEKRKAAEECSKLRENLSGCIATKIATQSQALSNLSFSGRKILEDAIKDDCTKGQGKCKGTYSSEIKCEEKKVAAAEGEGAEGEGKAGEAEKKDDKKKKK